MTGQVDDGRRQFAQADGLFDDLLARDSTRRTDDERDVQLGIIQARTMTEAAGVLTEAFAVVCHDDQPGPFQRPQALECIQQPPELLIEVCNAIVVRPLGKIYAPLRNRRLVQKPPASDQKPLVFSRGRAPKRCSLPGGSS